MQIFSNQTHCINLNQPQRVIQTLQDFLSILDENYGEDRDIYGDLGGYAVLAESKEDIQTIQTQIIKGTVPEDVEEIICGDGQVYCSSLFILSCDYAIMVLATKELTEQLLQE